MNQAVNFVCRVVRHPAWLVVPSLIIFLALLFSPGGAFFSVGKPGYMDSTEASKYFGLDSIDAYYIILNKDGAYEFVALRPRGVHTLYGYDEYRDDAGVLHMMEFILHLYIYYDITRGIFTRVTHELTFVGATSQAWLNGRESDSSELEIRFYSADAQQRQAIVNEFLERTQAHNLGSDLYDQIKQFVIAELANPFSFTRPTFSTVNMRNAWIDAFLSILVLSGIPAIITLAKLVYVINLHERRRYLHQCLRCGYSLKGIGASVCPECGTQINPSPSPAKAGATSPEGEDV